jgi:hypothetical protein
MDMEFPDGQVRLSMTTRRRQIVAEVLSVAAAAALLLAAARVDRGWMGRHVTQLNLWPEPEVDAYVWWARAVLASLGVLVLVVLRPLLAGFVRAASIGRLAASTGMSLIAVAASLVTVEGYQRWRESRGKPTRLTHELFGVRHPRYGWIWAPSRRVIEVVAGREVHWTLNRDGIRVPSQDHEPDPSAPTILFTGESIAAGMGLEWPETYPALVAQHLGVQGVNLAANAYGSDQAYLRLVDFMPRFPRLVATVTLFLPVQLSRNLQDDKPRLALGHSGALELVPATTDFLSRMRVRKLFWNDLPYLGDGAIDRTLALTSAILRDTAERTRARGATPVFVIVSYGPPRTLDQHPEAWIVRALFVQQRLPFVLVDIPPALQLNGDAHPGPRGAAKIAEAIEDALGRGSGAP